MSPSHSTEPAFGYLPVEPPWAKRGFYSFCICSSLMGSVHFLRPLCLIRGVFLWRLWLKYMPKNRAPGQAETGPIKRVLAPWLASCWQMCLNGRSWFACRIAVKAPVIDGPEVCQDDSLGFTCLWHTVYYCPDTILLLLFVCHNYCFPLYHIYIKFILFLWILFICHLRQILGYRLPCFLKFILGR